LTLNGKTYTNGLMVVSGGGVLTNSQTGATFNGGLSNAATVFLPNATTSQRPRHQHGSILVAGHDQ